MFEWWNVVDSLLNINSYASLFTLMFAAATVILALLARYFLGRASDTGKSSDNLSGQPDQEVGALKRAAGEMRKEMLEAQQSRDVMEQLLKSAESEIRKLKNELTRKNRAPAVSEKTAPRRNNGDSRKNASVGAAAGTAEKIEVLDEGALTVSQKHQLSELLGPGPKGNIDIVSMLGNEKSERLAREIDEILTENGWTTNGVSPSAVSNTPKDIIISVHSKDTAPTYALFLQRTLSIIGLPVSGSVNRKVREWSLMLVVGDVSPPR